MSPHLRLAHRLCELLSDTGIVPAKGHLLSVLVVYANEENQDMAGCSINYEPEIKAWVVAPGGLQIDPHGSETKQ